MGQRVELQAILEAITPNVYFQPPTGEIMEYPCIVYNRITGDTEFAGNYPYRHTHRYEITVMDKDPDSKIPDKVAKLATCIHNRFFATDHINHDVYNLYF